MCLTQDLLDRLAGDIKTLEEQTWGTWMDFRRLMSFGGVDPTPTSNDFGVLKDSRARYREMIEKVANQGQNDKERLITTTFE